VNNNKNSGKVFHYVIILLPVDDSSFTFMHERLGSHEERVVDISCDCNQCSFHASVLPSVFIIISAQQLRVSSSTSASNQLGGEREDASWYDRVRYWTLACYE
jgi:hypothetical protein